MSANRKLHAVIAVETVLLIILGVSNLRLRESMRPSLEYYEAFNPLLLALEYESPLSKFEQIVKRNPAWLSYREDYKFFDQTEAQSILSKCAILGYTNHVRILIENGADPDEAIRWNRNYGSDDAARLVEEISGMGEGEGTLKADRDTP